VGVFSSFGLEELRMKANGDPLGKMGIRSASGVQLHESLKARGPEGWEVVGVTGEGVAAILTFMPST